MLVIPSHLPRRDPPCLPPSPCASVGALVARCRAAGSALATSECRLLSFSSCGAEPQKHIAHPVTRREADQITRLSLSNRSMARGRSRSGQITSESYAGGGCFLGRAELEKTRPSVSSLSTVAVLWISSRSEGRRFHGPHRHSVGASLSAFRPTCLRLSTVASPCFTASSILVATCVLVPVSCRDTLRQTSSSTVRKSAVV